MTIKLKAFHVDIKYVEEPEIIKRFKEIIELVDKAYVVIENGKVTNKRHLQGMISYEDDDKEKITKKIRNIIVNKLLDKQGKKGDYSFTDVKKYEEYMIYLSKGDGEKPPEIIYKKGITEEDIDRYRDTAIFQQTQYKEAQEKKQSQNKAKQYIEWFKEHKLKSYYDWTHNKYDFQYGRICEDIMEFFNFKLMLFKNQIIEQYLHFTYNTIVREHQNELFLKYQKKIKQKLMYDFVDFA